MAEKTLIGHASGVLSLRLLSTNVLVSGARDSTILVWDVEKGESVKTLKGHSDQVTSLEVVDGQLVSGSTDKSIKVWNADGECVQTLVGHSDGVCALEPAGNGRIASASWDGTVRVWRLDNATCESTLDAQIPSGFLKNGLKFLKK